MECQPKRLLPRANSLRVRKFGPNVDVYWPLVPQTRWHAVALCPTQNVKSILTLDRAIGPCGRRHRSTIAERSPNWRAHWQLENRNHEKNTKNNKFDTRIVWTGFTYSLQWTISTFRSVHFPDWTECFRAEHDICAEIKWKMKMCTFIGASTFFLTYRHAPCVFHWNWSTKPIECAKRWPKKPFWDAIRIFSLQLSDKKKWFSFFSTVCRFVVSNRKQHTKLTIRNNTKFGCHRTLYFFGVVRCFIYVVMLFTLHTRNVPYTFRRCRQHRAVLILLSNSHFHCFVRVFCVCVRAI